MARELVSASMDSGAIFVTAGPVRDDHPKQQTAQDKSLVSNKPDGSKDSEFLGPSCGEGTGFGWELESKVKKCQNFMTTSCSQHEPDP